MKSLFSPSWIWLILIGVALIGLSCLQYLWLKEAIYQKSLDLDYRTNAVLSQTTADWRMNYKRSWKALEEDKEVQQEVLQELSQTIEVNFREQQLPTSFDIGIYYQKTSEFILSNDFSKNTQILNSAHQLCLSCMVKIEFTDKKLTDTIGQSNGFVLQHTEDQIKKQMGFTEKEILYLSVFFPNEYQYVKGKVRRMFMLSLFFSLLLITTFLFTFYNWHKQKKLNEFKVSFINDLTHEFKTPLASILLATKTLQLFPEKQTAQTLLSLITNEGKRIENRIENILQLGMIENENLVLDKELKNVHILVEEVLNRLNVFVQQKNAKITLQLNAESPNLWMDEIHFGNVLYNLIDNALKYSPNEPRIQISTSKHNRFFQIKIKDEGIGMTAKVKEKIFDKFYRSPNAKASGFGLGLHYAQSIVALHQGKLKVESEEEKGTTFIILFPINKI